MVPIKVASRSCSFPVMKWVLAGSSATARLPEIVMARLELAHDILPTEIYPLMNGSSRANGGRSSVEYVPELYQPARGGLNDSGTRDSAATRTSTAASTASKLSAGAPALLNATPEP